MTTLKDHQATMVSMLASGTAIPTSAIRLAHALHDVLAYLNDTNAAPVAHTERRIDATTPGLNDALLAADVQAVKPKQQSLESLLKQRDNTIRQLKGRVADLVKERDQYKELLGSGFRYAADGEQLTEEHIAVIRKVSAASELPQHGFVNRLFPEPEPAQAGCRKEDTEVDWSECQHDYTYHQTIGAKRCMHCGNVAK